MARLLLILATSSYKSRGYLDASKSLGLEVFVATTSPEGDTLPIGISLMIDTSDLLLASEYVANFALEHRIDLIFAADDSGTAIAARANELAGLKAASFEAVSTTKDKAKMRAKLSDAEVSQPRWRAVSTDCDLEATIASIGGYPVVMKPTTLSGSRGVVRVNGERELDAAVSVIKEVIESCAPSERVGSEAILIESYVSGKEYALEGVLREGSLETLAIFEKPLPLEGPYFEESIYLLPNDLTKRVEKLAIHTIERSCRAMELSLGPVHAEFRITEDDQVMVVEVAARTIGGLCSRILRFGAARSLEEIVLAIALDLFPLPSLKREKAAAGVMMIPIEREGTLQGVSGIEVALETLYVDSVEITLHKGTQLRKVPYSDAYLGFIFARAPGRKACMTALLQAHSKLSFDIS